MFVYPKMVNLKKFIGQDAIDKDTVNSEFYGLINRLSKALKKCEKNYDYCDKWLLWLNGEKGTLLLRDLFKEIGFDYWENMYNSNIIDRLDSLQDKFIKQ